MSNPILDPPRSHRDIPTWQRALWALLPIATIGLAAWAPFLYWANRRDHGSGDQRWWLGFAAGTVAEVVFASVLRHDDNAASSLTGGFIILLALGAAVMAWIKLAPKRL
ncbi:MAG: hypothetical protein HOV68_03610 [Streptomycetaceae bacterium]|nr:hypothetical protein [Streptomycetaceae bacterium]